jgi:hypothetical protein
MASQVGQDLWVLSLFPEGYNGTFLDIGCRGPEDLNNTFLLEQKGWTGISIDIIDYSKEWKQRKTEFICADALTFDYRGFASNFLIDYLSLDIEGNGDRFKALQKVINDGFEFKCITIEHDAYRVHYGLEQVPQRDLLTSLGYRLLFPDVCDEEKPFEDWWVNPKYICLP